MTRHVYLAAALVLSCAAPQKPQITDAADRIDKAVAKRLHDDVFSVGNTVDPAEGYRAFRGHDAGTGALMRRRGFAPGDATARTRSKP